MMRWLDALTRPATNHVFVSQLFIKGLSVIYFAAFLSLSVQIIGLVGSDGILPFEQLLKQAFNALGTQALWRIPGVFWLDASNASLLGACIAGCTLAVMAVLNIFTRLALIGMFVLYLSLQHAGQTFLNFQWDYLLLESGFLAIFLVSGPSLLIIIMLEFLLFRLRFLSGVSKVLSDDPSWSTVSALSYYFETQPLPHIGGWFFHQIPELLLRAGTGIALASELIIPFFMLLPRGLRVFAALVTIAVQLAIIATSNHNFLNLLAILLCLFLLDDRFFAVKMKLPNIPRHIRVMSIPAALLILSASLPLSFQMIAQSPLPETLARWAHGVRAFGIGNIYHVFPTMQTERQELIIQGSNNRVEWLDYEFKYKPGSLEQPPAIILPHQPRLDWMMWFVPPQHPREKQWFNNLMSGLSSNNPDIIGLLKTNPFGDIPPRYIRVLAYRYRFTTPDERQQTGHYWSRELLGEFPHVPPRIP